MKKLVVVVLLVVAAMAVFATGVVVAQGPQPPRPFGGMGGGAAAGPLHEYMEDAMAGALGITTADFEARRDSGKTAYQIALDLGFGADKIPALLSNARTQALDAAAADGAITQQQTEWMKLRGARMGMGQCGGTGQPLGAGMGRGWRWQQANP